MRHVVRGAVLLIMCIALCQEASAQVLGTIAGAAKDTSGAVLPGVTVEVSSPALIEKVRSATSDTNGLYRIVNLPPGVYVVTFSLSGFNTWRREGVEVSPGFTATIDSDMRVGNIQETITVTGESPVVDIQSAAQRRAVTDTQFKELPSGGSWIQMAALTSAVRASNQDVGGILGDQTGAEVSAHGSRNGDGVSMVDGLRIGNMYLSSNLTNMSLSPLLFDQVDVQLSGQSAETGTNGVIMNAIPKAGGNRFSGTALINGTTPDLQGTNLTQRLKDRNATSTTQLKRLYDINGAFGGPIKRDRAWFYATSRYFTNEYYIAARFYPVDPAATIHTNSAQQAYGGTYTYDNNGRVTVALNDKQKISGFYAYQYKVDPHWLIQVFNVSPEAARITTWHTQMSTTKWTYTKTNNLLFEAGVAAGASPDTIKTDLSLTGGPVTFPLTSSSRTPLVEQGSNLNFRAPTNWDWDDRLPSQSFNGSMSYVTGSHNAKVGMEMQRGYFQRGDNNESSTSGVWYTVAVGVPQFVTVQSPLAGWRNKLNYNLGIFAQDQWTLNRLTLNGGVRVDMLNESTAPFTAAPHRWLPNRNNTFAAVENVPNWKDVNPRISAAYDLFGTGKTALKASASRGVEQDSIRYAAANNPAATVQTSTARVWNDNGNFVPDCDLVNGANQDNRATGGDLCGPWLTPSFGSAIPGTRYDSAVMEGWGVRPSNWEFSTGVQHQIIPRLSASFGYFRRIQGNFFVLDNEAYGPNDFTEFSVTAPTNARLPQSGQVVTGFLDPIAIRAPQNVIKDASQFGKQKAHWNGFDMNLDARLKSSLYLQGGFGVGKGMSDFCEIADDVPEMLQASTAPAGIQALVRDTAFGVAGPPGVWTSKQDCHQETPWQAQYKALGSYTLPWYDIRVSGTWQSILGPQRGGFVTFSETANGVTTFARTTQTTLGRPLTNSAAVLNVSPAGTLWGDRLNQIDFRFTKILRLPTGRLDLNLDVYNAFNSDAITTELNSVGPVYGLPIQVIPPRFAKISARWDF